VGLAVASLVLVRVRAVAVRSGVLDDSLPCVLVCTLRFELPLLYTTGTDDNRYFATTQALFCVGVVIGYHCRKTPQNPFESESNDS